MVPQEAEDNFQWDPSSKAGLWNSSANLEWSMQHSKVHECQRMSKVYGFVWKCCVPLNPMVLLIIVPMKMAISLGILTKHFQTNPYTMNSRQLLPVGCWASSEWTKTFDRSENHMQVFTVVNAKPYPSFTCAAAIDGNPQQSAKKWKKWFDPFPEVGLAGGSKISANLSYLSIFSKMQNIGRSRWTDDHGKIGPCHNTSPAKGTWPSLRRTFWIDMAGALKQAGDVDWGIFTCSSVSTPQY